MCKKKSPMKKHKLGKRKPVGPQQKVLIKVAMRIEVTVQAFHKHKLDEQFIKGMMIHSGIMAMLNEEAQASFARLFKGGDFKAIKSSVGSSIGEVTVEEMLITLDDEDDPRYEKGIDEIDEDDDDPDDEGDID